MEFLASSKILIAVAVLVFIAIVLDGMRRAKRNRYENLQMSSTRIEKVAKRNAGVDDVEDMFSGDFPSGKSRVVGVRNVSGGDMEDVLLSHRDISERYATTRQPRQGSIDLDGSSGESESALNATGDRKSNDSPSIEPQVMIVHLMADKGDVVSGKDLLQALLDAGLRYGAMGIFHFHNDDQGSGPVLFSLANLLNPGTFDLNTMDDMTTPGATLFMNLDEVADPLAAFDVMVSAAESIAEALRLQVMDEARCSMTRQTIDHSRQRAREAAGRRSAT